MDALLARSIDLALAGAGGFIWLWLFYRQDKYEPEPKSLVALAVGVGVLCLGVVRWGNGLFPGGLAAAPWPWARGLIEVAIPEELVKALALACVFYHHAEFNEPMDGIVYGASIGVGFATAESVLYMSQVGRGVLLLRVLFTTALHVCGTALVGYGLGVFKFTRRRSQRLRARMAPVAALVGAIAVHAVFDGIVSLGMAHPDPHRLGLAIALLGVCAITLVMVLETEVDEALCKSPFRPLRRRRRKSGSR